MIEARRIVIMGAPGSGKTTLARALSARLDVVHVERDAHDSPDDPIDGFPRQQRDSVLAAIDAATSGWILDGAPYWYEREVYDRAELIVALDYAKPLVLFRAFRRTAANLLARKERLADLASRTHALRWTWTVHAERRREIADLQAQRGDVLVFRAPSEAALWLDGG